MSHSPFAHLKNPTGKHKDWYGPPFIKVFCEQLNKDGQIFDSAAFIKKYKQKYTQCELKERLNLIVDLLDAHVNKPYTESLDILGRLFGEPLLAEEGMFNYGYHLYPVSQFVERHGAQSTQASLDFIEQLTMRFTGEWAIRTVANADERATLKRMVKWSKSSNVHVRRLSSEGLRARLPWGKKIEWIEANPEKALPIYDRLRNDKSLYVRKSVANSMGDIVKLNEGIATDTFDRWLAGELTKDNLWVIKHAIRTPVKKGHKKLSALHRKIAQLMRSH